MKQVISVKDLQEMVRSGQSVASLPPDALLTPSARDFLRDLEKSNSARPANPPLAIVSGPPAKPLSSNSPKPELETFLNSKLETLEAYCRTILAAGQLGKPANPITPAQLQDLLKLRQGLGIPDTRHGLKECELCDNSEWSPGAACSPPQGESQAAGFDPEAEAAVKAITDQIMAEICK
jgi:L-fuculose-phosphate aldolase